MNDDLIRRQAVLDILEKEGHKWGNDYRDWVDAVNEVETLPSVNPQEPCDDVISRKSIKQKLQEHHDFFVNAYGGFSNLSQNDKPRVDEITNCIAMVVNEPPVTPQPKTGHWILGVCDECGYDWGKDAPIASVPNFCPNCGCRMVEPKESEIHCNCTDAEIAKSFIEDVEAVKDLLPQKRNDKE